MSSAEPTTGPAAHGPFTRNYGRQWKSCRAECRTTTSMWLPPAYIATAGFDPIRDDGEAYADKLRGGGIPVVLSRQGDLPHAYFNFVGMGGRFAEAASDAAGALRLELAPNSQAMKSATQRGAGEFVGVGDIP
jgi:acetyl esterase